LGFYWCIYQQNPSQSWYNYVSYICTVAIVTGNLEFGKKNIKGEKSWACARSKAVSACSHFPLFFYLVNVSIEKLDALYTI